MSILTNIPVRRGEQGVNMWCTPSCALLEVIDGTAHASVELTEQAARDVIAGLERWLEKCEAVRSEASR